MDIFVTFLDIFWICDIIREFILLRICNFTFFEKCLYYFFFLLRSLLLLFILHLNLLFCDTLEIKKRIFININNKKKLSKYVINAIAYFIYSFPFRNNFFFCHFTIISIKIIVEVYRSDWTHVFHSVFVFYTNINTDWNDNKSINTSTLAVDIFTVRLNWSEQRILNERNRKTHTISSHYIISNLNCHKWKSLLFLHQVLLWSAFFLSLNIWEITIECTFKLLWTMYTMRPMYGIVSIKRITIPKQTQTRTSKQSFHQVKRQHFQW